MTDLVAIAMTARQKGMPKEDVHLVIKDESRELRDIFEVIVDNAYKFPVLESGAEAEIFIAEYANNYFVDCINLPKDR